MGYSVATPMRDTAARTRMLKFLDQNFRHFSELLGRPRDEDRYYRGPLHDKLPEEQRLSYDRGPCRIGFDHNESGPVREYLIVTCRWMALRAGSERIFPTANRPELRGNFPVYVHDGDEAEDPVDGEGPMPVVLDKPGPARIPKRVQWCLVDENGVQSRPGPLRRKITKVDNELYGYDGMKIIQKEMRRLTALWPLEAK